MAETFLLLYVITNKNTVKLMELARLPSASTSPAETRSNNSDTYTLLKPHIPWVLQSFSRLAFMENIAAKPKLCREIRF